MEEEVRKLKEPPLEGERERAKNEVWNANCKETNELKKDDSACILPYTLLNLEATLTQVETRRSFRVEKLLILKELILCTLSVYTLSSLNT